jgi:hypothetical protein
MRTLITLRDPLVTSVQEELGVALLYKKVLVPRDPQYNSHRLRLRVFKSGVFSVSFVKSLVSRSDSHPSCFLGISPSQNAMLSI